MWQRNSLSIVLAIMFVLALGGHSLTGWREWRAEQEQHGEPAGSYVAYIRSSDFGESVFENWESEFLQMGCYVLLTVFLFQKGSSESKKRDGTDEVDEDPAAHQGDREAPGPVQQGGWRLTLYRNSLSLAFLALFVVSFLGHAASGARQYRAEQLAHGETPVRGMFDYLTTARFWFESFQNWQSEFLAVLSIVVLSIWLRQWGSPESKPVHAAHSETGK